MAGEIYVKGLREFLRATDHAGKKVKKETRNRIREAGNIVRDEARRLFSPIDAASAANFRTYVRYRGVSVEQAKRRVTGKRPDYGALQMKDALLPARARKMPEVERNLEKMLDEIEL